MTTEEEKAPHPLDAPQYTAGRVEAFRKTQGLPPEAHPLDALRAYVEGTQAASEDASGSFVSTARRIGIYQGARYALAMASAAFAAVERELAEARANAQQWRADTRDMLRERDEARAQGEADRALVERLVTLHDGYERGEVDGSDVDAAWDAARARLSATAAPGNGAAAGDKR